MQSKKADFEHVKQMIANYAGVNENDPKIKKIALFFSASCGETLKYMFKWNVLIGSTNNEIGKLETAYKEIIKSLTKDDFSTFEISGLDALIKTTFENKN